MQPSLRVLSLAGLFASLTALTAHAQCLEWDARFFTPGARHSALVNHRVLASVVFDDGSGPALYVGGAFLFVADAHAPFIAKWDGVSWSSVGGGVNNDVIALAVFDDGSGPALYAGGAFTTAGGMSANHVAKWDGSSWSALGSGMDGDVYGFAAFDDGSGQKLHAAGGFSTAGGSSADRVAKWDGTSWSALGSGITSGNVSSIAAYDDGSGSALYVGGDFTIAGAASALRIAKWDGASWSALGAGMQGNQSATHVRALVVHDDGSGPQLYAGGLFVTAGGVVVDNIARWNGSTWSSLGGGGTNDEVWTLAVHDDGSGSALFVGGNFLMAGAASVTRIAKWDETVWTALGSGADATVRTLTTFDAGSGTELVAGGDYVFAGGQQAGGIATWDGATWSRFGDCGRGFVGSPRSLTVFDDGTGPALYAGGATATAGCVSGSSVNRWDGSTWEPLGNLGGNIYALASFDDGSGPALHAAGGVIARWNGTSWSPLGAGIGGFNAVVYALAVFDDGSGPALYAAGRFPLAGGVDVHNIARWDGTSWSAVGAGIQGGFGPVVYALAVYDDGTGPALYAGGNFSDGGGTGIDHLARWDGSNWSAVGAGVSSTVQALTVFDDGSGPALYVGGGFGFAGGAPAQRVAKWDGTSWSPLGSGVGAQLTALSAFDDGSGPALYAGGVFITAGGASARCVAKWDGASWSPLGSGLGLPSMYSAVYAMAVFDDGVDGAPDLYVGGEFSSAGSIPSSGIAQWHGCEPGAPYCFGDGLDPVVTAVCPCTNFGDPGRGCANSNGALGGGHLRASGTTSPNTVLLTCDGIPNGALATFMRGPNHNVQGAVFGDGIKCLTSPLFRFGSQNAGTIGNPPSTVEVGAPNEVPGATVHYFVQYRNSVPGFCAPETFNASNGYTIVW